MKRVLIAAATVGLLSGCGIYQSPKVADFCPDGINLTEQVDNSSPHDTSTYIGASWNLNKVGSSKQ